MVAVCLMLAVIFVSYSLTVYLADAAAGLVPADMIVKLVLLKTAIALEVLLPIALYLSVIVALGRLYSDYEMTALAAAGFSNARILYGVGKLCLVVAVVVGGLSLYLRPWAYQQSYRLQAEAEAEIEIDRLEEGQFYNSVRTKRTVFADEIDARKKHLEHVFVQTEHDERSRIIYAQQAYQPNGDGSRELVFLNGYVYELDRQGNRDRILKFGELTLHMREPEPVSVDHRRKAMSTAELACSTQAGQVAELQWRLSTPLSTVLLGLIAVPLSRTAPRRGKYAKFLSAVLIYAIYYNVGALAKTWVEQGVTPPVPGIWWVQALLAGALLALISWPVLRLRFG